MEVDILENLSTANILFGKLSEAYDVRLAHERAHEKHDPSLAPHGFFRQLQHGKTYHALEFLKEFGPLRLTSGQREGTELVRVELGEFWGLHRRFCLICDLWESIHDREKLAAAWKGVNENRAEVSLHEDHPLGSFLMTGKNGDAQVAISTFPWERANMPFDDWHRSVSFSEMRKAALWLIHSELDLHMRGRTLCWERGWERSETKFRPITHVDSLWSLLWEFFGLDTAEMFWRRCPHCQRIFYARRKDQFYCTPRQQGLASKRAYATRRRSQEKQSTSTHRANKSKDLKRKPRTMR
jgi:hypothetical protein